MKILPNSFLTCLKEGLTSSKDIAHKMGVSTRTVRRLKSAMASGDVRIQSLPALLDVYDALDANRLAYWYAYGQSKNASVGVAGLRQILDANALRASVLGL